LIPLFSLNHLAIAAGDGFKNYKTTSSSNKWFFNLILKQYEHITDGGPKLAISTAQPKTCRGKKIRNTKSTSEETSKSPVFLSI